MMEYEYSFEKKNRKYCQSGYNMKLSSIMGPEDYRDAGNRHKQKVCVIYEILNIPFEKKNITIANPDIA